MELYYAYQKCLKYDFIFQKGYLFKGTRSCIPKCGTRELLIREIHEHSLASHYGENKTLTMLKEHYFLTWHGEGHPRHLDDMCYMSSGKESLATPRIIHASTSSHSPMGSCDYEF